MTPLKIPLYRVHMPSDTHQGIEQMLYGGEIAGGGSVRAFESGLREFIGNPRLTTTGDGSSSLTLSLYMSGIGPGDVVLTSPLACLASTMPIKNLFADVEWCDVDPATGSLDPADVELHASARAKAILAVHWAGNPVDVHSLQSIARRHGLRLVEDASEALGAEVDGKRVGNNGVDFTVFSFYANRHVTTGDGGAIAFGNEVDFADGIWLKRYGIHQPSFRDSSGEISRTSDIARAGFDTYLNNISATIGVAQLPHIGAVVSRHQANGRFYDDILDQIPGVTLLRRLPGSLSAYWVYTLYAERRDDLRRSLRDRGIQASCVHLRNDIYSCFGRPKRELPGVDYFDQHNLSIPCGWWVSDEARDYVVSSIKAGW